MAKKKQHKIKPIAPTDFYIGNPFARTPDKDNSFSRTPKNTSLKSFFIEDKCASSGNPDSNARDMIIDPYLSDELKHTLKTNPVLIAINIKSDKVKLNFTNMDDWLEVLRENNTLKKVDFSNHELGNEGLKNVLKALQEKSFQIEELNFTANNIDFIKYEDVCALENISLKKLILDSNPLSNPVKKFDKPDEGLKWLFKALSKKNDHHALYHLSLRNIKLNTTQIDSIIEGLPNTKLQSIDLTNSLGNLNESQFSGLIKNCKNNPNLCVEINEDFLTSKNQNQALPTNLVIKKCPGRMRLSGSPTASFFRRSDILTPDGLKVVKNVSINSIALDVRSNKPC